MVFFFTREFVLISNPPPPFQDEGHWSWRTHEQLALQAAEAPFGARMEIPTSGKGAELDWVRCRGEAPLVMWQCHSCGHRPAGETAESSGLCSRSYCRKPVTLLPVLIAGAPCILFQRTGSQFSVSEGCKNPYVLLCYFICMLPLFYEDDPGWGLSHSSAAAVIFCSWEVLVHTQLGIAVFKKATFGKDV